MASLGNITRPYFERMTKAGPRVEPIKQSREAGRSGRERSEINTDDARGGIVLLAQHSNGDTSIHLGNYE